MSSSQSLKSHINNVHLGLEIRNFPCPNCPLRCAKRKLHSGEPVRKYACNNCEKRFYERHRLNQHEEAVHTKSGRFRCSICLKYLGGRDQLNMHMKSHLNKKDFVCLQCRLEEHLFKRPQCKDMLT